MRKTLACLLIPTFITFYNTNKANALSTEVENEVNLLKNYYIQNTIGSNLKDKIILQNYIPIIKCKNYLEEQYELKQKQQLQEYYDSICYFNPNNISEPSNISVDKIYEMLESTTYQDWSVAQAFKDAESNYIPVNSIFLIALTKRESAHGKSNLSNTNNNISSWRTPNRGNGWRYFNSKSHCIYETSNLISNKYLNPKGEYYNGVDIWSVGNNYCEGNEWANAVLDNINDLKNGIY